MINKSTLQWIISLIIPVTLSLIGISQIPVVNDKIHSGWLCCKFNLLCEDPQHINPPDMPGDMCWVAYSPTHYNPDIGLKPNETDVRKDLKKLREAGFKGLVTYTAKGVLGEKFPTIAQEEGFAGLIVGVWDPFDVDELHQAEATAKFDITKGFVVGNEGLYPKNGIPSRYTVCRLKEWMNALRRKTNKPVTTSEDSEAYTKHTELWELGDWVFPNAHPYWAGKSDPTSAAKWTREFFNNRPRGGKPIVFKEVGLPTIGGTNGPASEKWQAQYYAQLSDPNNRVNFVFFEAFDQEWKSEGKGEAVGRSWGVFRSDRSPKLAAECICGKTSLECFERKPSICKESAPTTSVFYVYQDAGADNHFDPTGPMGDIGDLSIKATTSTRFTYQGSKTALKIDYTPMGRGPNACKYPPCKWTGMRWQYPPENFGEKRDGYDLRGFRWFRFAARSDSPITVKFLVGGIPGTCGDSITSTIEQVENLTPDWQEYSIDLASVDLHHVIGGFGFTVNWPDNNIERVSNQKFTFYLDEVRFER